MKTLVVALLAASANAFKFMANWKMPTPQGAIQAMEAKKMFGEKKLVVITGTSSGLGRKTVRARARPPFPTRARARKIHFRRALH